MQQGAFVLGVVGGSLVGFTVPAREGVKVTPEFVKERTDMYAGYRVNDINVVDPTALGLATAPTEMTLMVATGCRETRVRPTRAMALNDLIHEIKYGTLAAGQPFVPVIQALDREALRMGVIRRREVAAAG